MLPAEYFEAGCFDKSNVSPDQRIGETITDSSLVHINSEGSHFLDHVCGCANGDKSVVHVLKELVSGVNLQGHEWEEHDGIVLFREKVYVPLDGQLQHDIVEAHHDTPVTGHSGRWKMTELVAHSYWWPGMGCYVAKYVKGCNFCNRTKTFLTALTGKLMPNHVPDHGWQAISVDIITELPQSSLRAIAKMPSLLW